MSDPAAGYDPRALWRTLPPEVQERLGALVLGHSLLTQSANALGDDDPDGEEQHELAAEALSLIDDIVAEHFGPLLDEGAEPDLDGLDLVLSGGQVS